MESKWIDDRYPKYKGFSVEDIENHPAFENTLVKAQWEAYKAKERFKKEFYKVVKESLLYRLLRCLFKKWQ